MRRRLARSAATAIAAWALETADLRAEAVQAPAPADAPQSSEVMVTARRRPELLAHVAAPVSAATGKEIREKLVTKVEDLQELFPALTVQPTATGNLIFIRGVGNFTLQPNSDPAVGFLYDGVALARPSGTMGELFDLDRVELLKGPQGVLFGRNASAGSIKVEPRQPILGATEGSAELIVASFSRRRLESAVNLPLGKAAALRISSAFDSHGPYLAGYAHRVGQESVRVQAKVAPTADMSVRISADYSHLGGAGIGSSYVGRYIYSAVERRYEFIASGLPLSQGIYSPAGQAFRQSIFLPGAGRSLDAIGSRPGQDDRFYGVHAHAEADLGFATLVVLPAWRRVSLDLINAGSPFGYQLVERDGQTSLEARLTSRPGALEWLAGALLFHETIDSNAATNLSSSLILSDQKYDTRSQALFANGSVHLSRKLTASGGLRWTRDDKRFEGQSDTLSILCLQRLAGLPSCPAVPLFPLADDFADLPLPIPAESGGRLPIRVGGVDTGALVARSGTAGAGRLSDRNLLWRLGAEFTPGAHSLIYATAETGRRPGGFNIATGFETYGPERLTAFTLGWRQRAFGERLQVDAEVFRWAYLDQQVSSLRPDLSTPPRNTNITDNIGNSHIRGVEVDARAEPWSGAFLRAVVQFLDAKYRSFDYVQANVGVPPLTGCPATLDRASNLYSVDCSMKQPYNSPRWSLVMSASQRFRVGRLVATAGLDTHFRSGRNVGFAFLAEQHVGPAWTTDLRATIAPAIGNWDVAVFVQNLEDRRTPEFIIYHPVSDALIASTTPPREVGVRIGVRY